MFLGMLPFLIQSGCGNSPQPPPAFFVLRATYSNLQNEDLLDQTLPNSYRQADLTVFSHLEQSGKIVVEYFNNDDKGIPVHFDEDLQSWYFDLSIPTNAGYNPIETIVKLSPTDSDTVTYTFGANKYKYAPDQIFYNKLLVWRAIDIVNNEKFPPIQVVK